MVIDCFNKLKNKSESAGRKTSNNPNNCKKEKELGCWPRVEREGLLREVMEGRMGGEEIMK